MPTKTAKSEEIIMNKKTVLEVIKPFAMMEVGDTFELSDNGTFVSTYDVTDESTGAAGSINSRYSSVFEISDSYAEALISEGVLAPKTISSYTNVFAEIESLRNTYEQELCDLDKDCAECPACIKVEKEAVLRNMITLLDHLNGLKK